jgi:hypothetical protein
METAYCLNYINGNGATVREIVTRCPTLDHAVQRAIDSLPLDCAEVEVSTMYDDHVLWRSGQRAG